jgi:hypothetical protein
LNFVLEYFEEELFKTKERIIEISIEKDQLFDSVSDLERQCYLWRKKCKKLQKLYDKIKKVHQKCIPRILYR